jgi:hypothetical protein
LEPCDPPEKKSAPAFNPGEKIAIANHLRPASLAEIIAAPNSRTIAMMIESNLRFVADIVIPCLPRISPAAAAGA